MIYSLLLVIALVIFVILNKKWRLLPKEQRNKQLRQTVLWLLAGVTLLLVVTGRAHWLMGVLAGLMAVLGRLAAVAQYIPLFRNLMGQAKAQTPPPSSNLAKGKMSVNEAAAILGIDTNADKDEITKAHKKLMQKVHPDRGGSDALAAQINQAKEVMLTHVE